jgi:hypothetical protein
MKGVKSKLQIITNKQVIYFLYQYNKYANILKINKNNSYLNNKNTHTNKKNIYIICL